MKILVFIFKALFGATVGYIIYIWDNFTYKKATTDIDSTLTIKEVWQEYKEYWLKHEPKTTAPETCIPCTEKEILKLEHVLDVKLPEDLRISFKSVNHHSKKCDDNLTHSWFGSKTGVSLSTPSDMIDKNSNSLQSIDLLSADYNIYDGKITPYDPKQGLKKCILIASKYDVIFFMDLRENIGNEYGQIIAFIQTFEGANMEGRARIDLLHKLSDYTPNPNNSFNNFVFVAKDYKTFMQIMLEEIKQNGELKDRYFTNLFGLKADYFW